MIDTLKRNLKKAYFSSILDDLGVEERHYALVTVHRPTNVDNPIVLRRLLEVFELIGRELPVIFPVHPRTKKNIENFEMSLNGRLQIIDPIGYLDFLKLMFSAKVVLTDSGGVQEETTILKVPCLTLRENTERPVTIDVGLNTVVGTDPVSILKIFYQVVKNGNVRCGIPELWDGHAAERIVEILLRRPLSRPSEKS